MAVGVFSPTELLLDTCARGIVAQHRYGAIQWIADAAMLLRRAEPAIDWTQLVTRTSQSAVTLRMMTALHCLHSIVGMAIPAPVMDQLQLLPVQPLERWELHLPNRLPTAARKFVTRWLDRQRHWRQQNKEHTYVINKVKEVDVSEQMR